MSLLTLLQSPWAIQPERLQEIQALYATHLRGDKIDIDAVEARLGRPLANDQQEYSIREGGVAVLSIEGVLAPKANLFMRISGGASTQMLTTQIESAMADPRVRSLVLDIDSPGGSVLGTPELGAAVRVMALEKPIVTVCAGVLASASYWFGAAANAVYITGPTVEVGSIGVVATHSYNPRAAETQTEITAGKYKRIASSLAPLSAEGRAHVQADVDYLYSVFVDAVADYRGASADQVLERMADGRVFRGQQAIDAGLVDGVSTVDAMVEQLATNPATFAKRRKAVFAVAARVSTGAGVPPVDESSPREKGNAMPDPITRESFERDHAALFAQMRGEFVALGASQELARIQGVRATLVPGHEALVDSLAFDGKSSPGDAALAVNAAVRTAHQAAATAHAADAPPAAAGALAPPDKDGKTKTQMAAEAQALAAKEGIDTVAALKQLGYA